MTPSAKPCLLVVDDEPNVSDSVHDLLRLEFHVLKARNADEGYRLMQEHEVHVIMTDQRMPKVTGVELLRTVRLRHPHAVRILYTGYADWPHTREALDAGASGVISKESPLSEVVRAISWADAGKVYLDPTLGGELIRPQPERPKLTPREREVLRHLADGLTHDEIGAVLYLSPETVRAHVKKATVRLGARNRMQAVAAAVRDGLIA